MYECLAVWVLGQEGDRRSENENGMDGSMDRAEGFGSDGEERGRGQNTAVAVEDWR